MKWITPDWPAPAWIKAVSTTRMDGVSLPPFEGLNLGCHVGDNPARVAQNRAHLANKMKMAISPTWLNQIHGTEVVRLPLASSSRSIIGSMTKDIPDADASYTSKIGPVCVVMTADCLPVLFCDLQGTQVAAAHAGWRGLLNGVLENTLLMFADPHQVMAWLGPAIGADAFEVGGEVRALFLEKDARANLAFKPRSFRSKSLEPNFSQSVSLQSASLQSNFLQLNCSQSNKWLADIYLLARQRLELAGVTQIYGGNCCTVSDPKRFFSYRRENRTGRQASCIWITKP